MRVLKLVVVLITVLLAIAACSDQTINNSTSNNANKPTAPNSNTAAAVNTSSVNSSTTAQLDGKDIYTQSCKICHQDTGKGGPTTVNGKKIKPADLTAGHAKKHTDDDLAKDISDGDPDEGMPAFKDKLKPDEIKAVVAYIRTLQQQ